MASATSIIPVPMTRSSRTATTEWSNGSSAAASQADRQESGLTVVLNIQRVTAGSLRHVSTWSRSSSDGMRNSRRGVRRGHKEPSVMATR